MALFAYSITTLLDYLRHFNPSADIYLGERYGYQLLTPNGFNYITGGGGIVFSVNVIKELAKSCTCPSLSSPDDMIIALCLQRLGIEPIHSSRFHQVRFLFAFLVAHIFYSIFFFFKWFYFYLHHFLFNIKFLNILFAQFNHLGTTAWLSKRIAITFETNFVP